MEPLSEAQLLELDEIAKLPQEEQSVRVKEFFSTLTPEQIEWLKSQQQTTVQCPFCLISGGKIRARIVYTDEDIIVFLQTTLDRSIFDLVNRPIEVGSLDSEVNTVIVMGYFPATQENPRPGRGLAVLKHRGSHYEQGIFEYQITDKGIQISR